MSNDMMERLARAARDAYDPDDRTPWDNAVRAILSELMEPSNEMLIAGCDAFMESGLEGSALMEAQWQAMLRSILDTKEAG